MKVKTATLILLVILFAACNDDASSSKTNKNVMVVATDTSSVNYQCPMKCQGDTAYIAEGQCPVCEMDLEKVAK